MGGLLSFFAPCVLPLVPIYLAYITGTTTGEKQDRSRWHTLTHALFFVLGFGILFVLLGAAAGLLGGLLYRIMPYIMRVGGVILIVLGLHMTGLIKIPFLYMGPQINVDTGKRGSYLTSLLVGLISAAGWTPCVGPVLSGILLLAADTQTALRGAGLLSLYTLGLGIPFLAVALLFDIAAPALKKINKYLQIISIIGGALLIVMGFLLVTGLFFQLSMWFSSLGV